MPDVPEAYPVAMSSVAGMTVMAGLARDPAPTLTHWVPAIMAELDDLRRQGLLRWLVALPLQGRTQDGVSQIFDQVKLEVILAGTTELWHQGGWTRVRAGGLLVVPPRVAHRQRGGTGIHCNLGIFASDDDIAMQINASSKQPRLLVGGRFHKARGRLVQQLVDEVLADPKSPAALRDQAQAMILSVLADAVRRPQSGGRGGDFTVLACRKHIERDFADTTLGLGALAQRLDRTPAALARLFLHKTGLTVNAALRQRRIVEAQRLLLRTTLTVDEIALRCGFSRRDSFTRAFRALANCSPRNYRRLGHLEGEVLRP